MKTLRVLIVDDEPLIRREIRAVLGPQPGLEIAGECETAEQALQSILSLQPDLVLLDVRLPDATGLDILRRVGPRHMPMVIFITAHEEYAVQAFNIDAVDYLLKPFDDMRLKKSIERARERSPGGDQRLTAAAPDMRMTKPGAADRLIVKNGDRYEFVLIRSIDWIESANNYVALHCGEKTHLLGETLSNLERKLDPRTFIRIHRCRIINLSRVVALEHMLHGSYVVEMKNGVRLTSGRQFRVAIERLINSAAKA
jgi:two-component system, LytTR family, response regulator